MSRSGAVYWGMEADRVGGEAATLPYPPVRAG